jgi:hypothetical protein
MLLVALFLVLVGYYGWTQLSDPGAGGAAPVPSRRPGSATARRVAGGEVVALATAALEAKPGVYQSGRDLFSYQAERPQQPRQRRPAAPKPEPETKPVAQTAPPAPQPPKVDVTYLGSFGRPGRRIAVFTDGEAVYNAFVGDVIKEKFILVSIGYESADLGFVGFPEAVPSRLAAGRMR